MKTEKKNKPKALRIVFASLLYAIGIVLSALYAFVCYMDRSLAGGLFFTALLAFFVWALVTHLRFIIRDKSETKQKKPKPVKLSFVLALVFNIVILILPLAGGAVVFRMFFNLRFENPESMQNHVENYDTESGWRLFDEEVTFLSDRGDTLVGHIYHGEYPLSDIHPEPKGVIVLAHGYGSGGENAYLPVSARLAFGGYTVFAYDVTGNGKSEGKMVYGFPQGFLDLVKAVEYVQGNERLNSYPLFLCGHSWGAYSVANALNYVDGISGVVEMSGFSCSPDVLEHYTGIVFGKLSFITRPYINLIEFFRFGNRAFSRGEDGIARTDAPVFVIHSADDPVVPFSTGYALYEKAFSDLDRVKFLRYEDRGHALYYSEAMREYVERFMNFNGNPQSAPPSDENEGVKGFDQLDESLFAEIIGFYDLCLEAE